MSKTCTVTRAVLFYSDHGAGRRGWCVAVHADVVGRDGEAYPECDCTSLPGSACWTRDQARPIAESLAPGCAVEDGEDDFHGAIQAGCYRG